jgi:hypothetical protein
VQRDGAAVEVDSLSGTAQAGKRLTDVGQRGGFAGSVGQALLQLCALP